MNMRCHICIAKNESITGLTAENPGPRFAVRAGNHKERSQLNFGDVPLIEWLPDLLRHSTPMPRAAL